jgi:thioesterase superfamily protein
VLASADVDGAVPACSADEALDGPVGEVLEPWLVRKSTRLRLQTRRSTPCTRANPDPVMKVRFDTVGPALLATLAPDQFQSTMSLSVSFLRPVRPGRVIGQGRIVHRDGDLAFLEATLADSAGAMIATATATARVISVDQARSAA